MYAHLSSTIWTYYKTLQVSRETFRPTTVITRRGHGFVWREVCWPCKGWGRISLQRLGQRHKWVLSVAPDGSKLTQSVVSWWCSMHPPVLFRRPSVVLGETNTCQKLWVLNNMFRGKATGVLALLPLIQSFIYRSFADIWRLYPVARQGGRGVSRSWGGRDTGEEGGESHYVVWFMNNAD
jgi:hypothetical protein